MRTSRGKQTGGSAFVNIIILLAVAYGVYLGIQYAPIFIESRTIDSILNNVRLANDSAQAKDRRAVETLIEQELTVNGLTRLRDKFVVQRTGDGYEVQVRYERPFNVLYEEKMLKINKVLVLQ